MKERIVYLDYIKAIGMILIILAHTSYLFSAIDLHSVPESCHVPIFFLAVGLVHAFFPIKGDIAVFTKKRFKSVLIPYIVFSVQNSILKLGTFFLSNKLNEKAFLDEMFDLFINGNGPVWFLGILFISDFLYAIICNKLKWGGQILFAIVLLTLVYIVGDCHNRWIYPLVRILGATSMIIIGSKSKFLFDIENIKRCVICVTLFSIWLLLIFVGNGENHYTFRPGYFLVPYHSIPLFLTGSYALMLFTTFIPKRVKWLEYIGKNSLGYLVIHPTLHMMYAFTVGKLVNTYNFNIQVLFFIVGYILFLLVCWPSNELLLKYMPWSLGKFNQKTK